ncbi:MAG: trypsin-like peptidase domain-containing protein [Lentisphaeria bacterium]|nr:trypsin-like peptidase domain-containing protein [Lentisphaeria bacterium]
MKSLFNTMFAVLAGACAALLVLKFVNPPVGEQAVYETKMREYAPPPAAAGTPAAWPDFTATIERAMPAVVCISNQRIVSSRRGFGRPAQYYEVPAGQGSGFFIREDGYILTNYHVASGANALLVTDSEGREYHADLVGADPTSDLAVLKVEPPKGRKFMALAFANPKNIRLGQWTLAIGAPFSLEHSVTAGIVSGVQRSGVGVNLYENYIQTDASINPGNSGGPLLNTDGDVIGVNDCILAPSGGNIGIAFAVSAEIAKTVADTLIAHGEIVRPWLGIMGARPSQMRSPGDENEAVQKGAAIRRIIEDSPAARLGLRDGDVIVKLDGVDVTDTYDLRNRILSLDPGTIVKLTIMRRNLLHETSVKLERAPANWFRVIPQIDYAIPL